jgi:hypothetical protein
MKREEEFQKFLSWMEPGVRPSRIRYPIPKQIFPVVDFAVLEAHLKMLISGLEAYLEPLTDHVQVDSRMLRPSRMESQVGLLGFRQQFRELAPGRAEVQGQRQIRVSVLIVQTGKRATKRAAKKSFSSRRETKRPPRSVRVRKPIFR